MSGGSATRERGAGAAAWAELLRVSALFTVPGDAIAGAAAAGHRPNRRTVLAAGSSLCLYEAGMALNDYSDRHIDAVERPGRPIPSGRITPARALMASTALTAAGLGLAAAAGRGALLTATALAGTVWAYDLRLKHTAFGPAAMSAARGFDLVMGAAATASASALPVHRRGVPREVLRAAGMLAAHTFAVTAVSRRETLGASSAVPLAALGAVGAVAAAAGGALGRARGGATGRVGALMAAAYAATAARPLVHAALNPSPPLLQRAVGGGIRATIPLQAALGARAGRPGSAALVLALLPSAARLSRKVSPT